MASAAACGCRAGHEDELYKSWTNSVASGFKAHSVPYQSSVQNFEGSSEILRCSECFAESEWREDPRWDWTSSRHPHGLRELQDPVIGLELLSRFLSSSTRKGEALVDWVKM